MYWTGFSNLIYHQRGGIGNQPKDSNVRKSGVMLEIFEFFGIKFYLILWTNVDPCIDSGSVLIVIDR